VFADARSHDRGRGESRAVRSAAHRVLRVAASATGDFHRALRTSARWCTVERQPSGGDVGVERGLA
jgi:hypothetical protein